MLYATLPRGGLRPSSVTPAIPCKDTERGEEEPKVKGSRLANQATHASSEEYGASEASPPPLSLRSESSLPLIPLHSPPREVCPHWKRGCVACRLPERSHERQPQVTTGYKAPPFMMGGPLDGRQWVMEIDHLMKGEATPKARNEDLSWKSELEKGRRLHALATIPPPTTRFLLIYYLQVMKGPA